MPTAGLNKDLLLMQAREAGRLFEEAKHSANGAAAELRAKELCRQLADSVKAEIIREESRASRSHLPARGETAPSIVRAGDGRSGTAPCFSSSPAAARASLDYSRFEAVARAADASDSETEAEMREPPATCPTAAATMTQEGAAEVVASPLGSASLPCTGDTHDRRATSTPCRNAIRSSLDYRRFDAVVRAAELEDIEEEGVAARASDHLSSSTDLSPGGHISSEEAYVTAHRLAGVIEELRSSNSRTPSAASAAPAAPAASAASASSAATSAATSARHHVPHVTGAVAELRQDDRSWSQGSAKPKAVATQNHRQPGAMYSSDYGRFAGLGEDSDSDGADSRGSRATGHHAIATKEVPSLDTPPLAAAIDLDAMD